MTQDQRLNLSHQLIRLGQLIEIGQTITYLLTKEKYVHRDLKDTLNLCHTNLDQARRRFISLLSDKSKELAETHILQEGTVLQVCTMIDFLMAMDKEHRDKLEALAIETYEDYNKQIQPTIKETSL